MEKSLGRIAEDAFGSSMRRVSGPNLWEETAAAVLARLEKDEEEPVAGQELTIGQAAKIAEDNGSTDILEYFNDDLSRFMNCGNNNCIYLGSRYRLAPKKVNNPCDPTTWESGVAIFVRDSEQDSWILDVFSHYKRDVNFKYCSGNVVYKYAKLATPEQVEAWKLINEDL